MPNLGWLYPAGFNLALLEAPTHCQHSILIDAPCRKCDGTRDYDGCEHGRPSPTINYDDQGNPVGHPTNPNTIATTPSPTPNAKNAGRKPGTISNATAT